jgi:phosphoribosyl 1,2-cyclic phosphodiesterase
MIVRFWGTRGSIATPGSSTMKYGGNTSCVEVRAGSEILVFDAGTGIRDLGTHLQKEFGKNPYTVHLFLSHTHWDHIQGFPFFSPAYMRNVQINVYGPPGRDKSLEDVFRGQMDTDYFPVTFGEMSPNIKIIEAQDPLVFGNVSIEPFYLNHPAICLGYRVNEGPVSAVYATDNEPYAFTLAQDATLKPGMPDFPKYLDDKFVTFIKKTDLFIAEAQYTLEEYQSHRGWGHSPVETVIEWAAAGDVKRLALFHHDPFHDDSFVDSMIHHAQELLKKKNMQIECFGAAEGMEISL